MNRPRFVYHLALRADWQRALRDGVYHGSAQDRADGFLHFSTAAQVVASAARHRAGEADLLLLRCAVATLGSALRWETSRGGARFPHLYGPLPVDAVERVEPLPLDDGGRHRFPVLPD